MTDATTDRHVFGLDLLRSAAILMVLASHFGDMFAVWYGVTPIFRISVGGFFGVELFFVLSGFLIGRLLLDVIDRAPDFRAWRIFMMRRWMRTLPLYWLWLVVLCIVWRPHFWEPGTARLWRDLPYFATLTQNLAWPMVDAWYGVSWSLAVEEFFYLLFSAVLLAGAARLGPRWFWGAVMIFLCVPPALRWQLPPDIDWGEVTSKVVLYRLDAIAFGTVMAWISRNRPSWLRHRALLAAVGLFVIAFIWDNGVGLLRIGEQVRRTLIFDAVSVGFALMLPLAATPTRVWPPIRLVFERISRQSYAIYLIHLSIAEFVNYDRDMFHLGPTLSVAITCGATWVLSALSYRFFERPILAWRPLQHPPGGVAPSRGPVVSRGTLGGMT